MASKAELKEFLVTWEIHILAASHREAAEQALKIQRDPNSIATVFVVRSCDDPEDVDTVDFEED